MLKLNFDLTNALAALRTAGALMLGNSLVVPVLTNGSNPYWWVLLISGVAMIGITCIRKGV